MKANVKTLFNWLKPTSALWDLVTRVVREHEQRIKALERKFETMSKQIDDLNTEVTAIDANEKALEQKETSEIAALNAEIADLKTQLVNAQSSGDAVAIQAATDKLHQVNARLQTLLAAESASTSTSPSTLTTAPASTSTSAPDLKVNIPHEGGDTIKM